MKSQIPLDPAARAEMDWASAPAVGSHPLAPDLAYKRLAIVNVVFVGPPGASDRQWVLVDTGIPGSASWIMRAAARRFGPASRPAAILLTHGHFDHIGALRQLTQRWQVPVYAHPLELPYLDGRASYPAADPAVGGGLMSRLSPLYPRGPVDVRPWLRPLPETGLPGLAGWRWIATPGHAPGHVSFFRQQDGALIVGDAFITTRQESAYSVLTQKPELHGPPQYFTPDWYQARLSVERLAVLEPELVITGHGLPMAGPRMRAALRQLAAAFACVAVPQQGRYLATAA